MKPLWIKREGTINRGALKGFTGRVVAFDSTEDEALIQLDSETFVNVSSEMIDQED